MTLTSDKAPINVRTIVCSACKWTKHDELAAIDMVVKAVIGKIRDMFHEEHEDYEYRGFNLSSFFSDKKNWRKKLDRIEDRETSDIILIFFVAGNEDPTYMNDGFYNMFYFSHDEILTLPKDMKESKWDSDQKNIVGKMIGQIAHGILHTLGAFHAETGIMTGKMNIFDDTNVRFRNIKFKNILDRKSFFISCESMSVIRTYEPSATIYYNGNSRRLTFTSDQSIGAVLFVRKFETIEVGDERSEKVFRYDYTDHYDEYTWLDAKKQYTTLCPEVWDYFVVVHFCGYYRWHARDNVLNNNNISEMIIF